jgi:hypothetical protein
VELCAALLAPQSLADVEPPSCLEAMRSACARRRLPLVQLLIAAGAASSAPAVDERTLVALVCALPPADHGDTRRVHEDAALGVLDALENANLLGERDAAIKACCAAVRLAGEPRLIAWFTRRGVAPSRLPSPSSLESDIQICFFCDTLTPTHQSPACLI